MSETTKDKNSKRHQLKNFFRLSKEDEEKQGAQQLEELDESAFNFKLMGGPIHSELMRAEAV